LPQAASHIKTHLPTLPWVPVFVLQVVKIAWLFSGRFP